MTLTSAMASAPLFRRAAADGARAPAAAGAAASALAAPPAWAYGSEAVDAQLLRSRTPDGKFTKEKQLEVPAPAEDGFTDARVATCLMLGAGLCAWDLAKGRERGLDPIKSETTNRKGSVTPLVQR